MGTRPAFLLALLISLVSANAAAEKPVLDVAPSLAELGEGWTTNSIISLLDPLSQPSGIAFKKPAEPKGLTGVPRTARSIKGRMGWVRMEYGRGDMVLNGGAYFVSIQRWGSTNALEKAWKGWKSRPDYTAWRGPPIGEACYWTEDEKYHGLTFRRGLFHVVVTCGSLSDHSGLFRLVEVIDAKIAGRTIPEDEIRSPEIRGPK
jgi:hypothetical protein